MENNGEGSDDGWVWTSLILMVGILSLGAWYESKSESFLFLGSDCGWFLGFFC